MLQSPPDLYLYNHISVCLPVYKILYHPQIVEWNATKLSSENIGYVALIKFTVNILQGKGQFKDIVNLWSSQN